MFGKLQEHEIELERLENHNNQEKKSKGIALTVFKRWIGIRCSGWRWKLHASCKKVRQVFWIIINP